MRYLRRPPGSTNQLGSPALQQEVQGLLCALGIRLRIAGVEHLDPGGQVLMWNQASHLDHLVLGATIPIPFRSLYNIEVGRFPLYGAWMREQEHFLVNRFDRQQWQAEVARAAAWVEEGNTVLVSPEGTRSWDGRLLGMKRGAMELAIRSQRPVVPLVIHDAGQCLPRGRIVVSPGDVVAEFLAPIPTVGCRAGDELAAELSAVFTAALNRGPGGADPHSDARGLRCPTGVEADK